MIYCFIFMGLKKIKKWCFCFFLIFGESSPERKMCFSSGRENEVTGPSVLW